jgi:hypothetical protein
LAIDAWLAIAQADRRAGRPGNSDAIASQLVGVNESYLLTIAASLAARGPIVDEDRLILLRNITDTTLANTARQALDSGDISNAEQLQATLKQSFQTATAENAARLELSIPR